MPNSNRKTRIAKLVSKQYFLADVEVVTGRSATQLSFPEAVAVRRYILLHQEGGLPFLQWNPKFAYRRFLVLIAGLGGLLYGIDVGIIAAALLYLSKSIDLTVGQTSILVAAVLGGSMVSSPVAGVLADWFGRRRMMILSGFMFVASVGAIVLSEGFGSLLLGRLLQGMSGGVIAVVVPLYLTECLGADNRGRGTALLNQGVSTLIAAVFLPVVGSLGCSAIFSWAGCIVVYFLTATFFVPEAKGKTLEEIYFEGKQTPTLAS